MVVIDKKMGHLQILFHFCSSRFVVNSHRFSNLDSNMLLEPKVIIQGICRLFASLESTGLVPLHIQQFTIRTTAMSNSLGGVCFERERLQTSLREISYEMVMPERKGCRLMGQARLNEVDCLHIRMCTTL